MAERRRNKKKTLPNLTIYLQMAIYPHCKYTHTHTHTHHDMHKTVFRREMGRKGGKVKNKRWKNLLPTSSDSHC